EMTSPNAAHRARLSLITAKHNEILDYMSKNGSNWLGQLLKAMSLVAQSNVDRTNSLQYRKEMLQKFFEFLSGREFHRIAKTDSAFAACHAFAFIFIAHADEMNEHAAAGSSMLFQPATISPSMAGTTGGDQ
ncbi:hypothetical protein PMAYCL1PPCAC_20837, partial [Pristionchus mayeri]